MRIEIISIISTTLLSLVAILANFILSYKQVRSANERATKQAENLFFAEYTKRYQDIILAMPDDVFDGTANINGRTLKYMQLYFDLCSEEYNLYCKGFIPVGIWNNWKEGMRLTLKMRLYHLCWINISGNYNPEFYRFFENEIISPN